MSSWWYFIELHVACTVKRWNLLLALSSVWRFVLLVCKVKRFVIIGRVFVKWSFDYAINQAVKLRWPGNLYWFLTIHVSETNNLTRKPLQASCVYSLVLWPRSSTSLMIQIFFTYVPLPRTYVYYFDCFPCVSYRLLPLFTVFVAYSITMRFLKQNIHSSYSPLFTRWGIWVDVTIIYDSRNRSQNS